MTALTVLWLALLNGTLDTYVFVWVCVYQVLCVFFSHFEIFTCFRTHIPIDWSLSFSLCVCLCLSLRFHLCLSILSDILLWHTYTYTVNASLVSYVQSFSLHIFWLVYDCLPAWFNFFLSILNFLKKISKN